MEDYPNPFYILEDRRSKIAELVERDRKELDQFWETEWADRRSRECPASFSGYGEYLYKWHWNLRHTVAGPEGGRYKKTEYYKNALTDQIAKRTEITDKNGRETYVQLDGKDQKYSDDVILF